MSKINRSFLSNFRCRFFGTLKPLLVLSLSLYIAIFPPWAWALNDTIQTWTFNTANAGQFTYDSSLMIVDDDGARPINKLANPSFATNNDSWTVAAIAPAGWVEVPGNSTYSTSNFLVMKYEAKCAADSDPSTGLIVPASSTFQTYDDSNIACTSANSRQVVSVASGYPIARIIQANAVTRCESVAINGSAVHLMNNNEWMTIARNMEVQAENWSESAVGSGLLFRGHNDNDPNAALVASTDDSQGYLGTLDTAGTKPDQKRTLVLSNGEVIWDLAGNAWEVLSNTIQRLQQPIAWDGVTNYTNGFAWSEYAPGVTTRFIREYKVGSPVQQVDAAPSVSTYNSNQGVGSMYHYSLASDINTTVYTYLRGGRWASGINAGIFTLGMDILTTANSLNIGFRCVSDSLGISQTHSMSSGRDGGGGNTVTMGTMADATLTQSVNVGDTATYNFSVYVYNNNPDGGVVDDTVAELFYNGTTITTDHDDTDGDGWYKLTGTLTGANEPRDFGVQVKAGNNLKLDDFTLSKQGTAQIYTTDAYSNAAVQSWDTFCEGTLVGSTCTEDATTPGISTIVYQLCADDGSTCESGSDWQYWDGAAWTTASNTTTHVNTPAELTQSVMQAFPIVSTKISIKTIMTFEGADIPELPHLSIGLTADTAAPSISITPISPDPSTDTTPTITGTATDTNGIVTAVEFQVDSTSGSWSSCTADDGAFDEASEAFTCQVTTSLGDGAHTTYIRATDNSNNITTTGNYASDTFTVDTVGGMSLVLVSPDDNSYTNSERPTFKWKPATDATTSITGYKLEIDNPPAGTNQPTGDFSVDDIPPERTTDYVTNRYIVRYENFSDTDPDNNYISVETRSSNEWSTDSQNGQNDGKLREGSVRWTVTATDAVGNRTSSSRIVFVDRTSPHSTITQINDIPFTPTSFSTTDTTPTIFGKITDPLSGTDTVTTQTLHGPKVASGPQQVDIKLEKKNGLIYQLHTLYTTNMDKPWYTCNNQVVNDNALQLCDKYLPFEFQVKNYLDLGTYRLTITGKDKAGNTAGDISFTFVVTTLSNLTTPEEKRMIEVTTQQLEPVEKARILEELEVTKPSDESSQSGLQRTTDNIISGSSTLLANIFNGIRSIFSSIGSGIAYVFNSIGHGYEQLAENCPSPLRGFMLGIRDGFLAMIQGIGTGISKIAFAVGEKVQDISDSTGYAIVQLGYVFVSEPTRIYDVKVETLSPTSARISWETNHPATSKVNYGLDETYPFDMQEDKLVEHHEFMLTDLQPGTQYHFEVMSHNKNYVYDANRKFTTPSE